MKEVSVPESGLYKDFHPVAFKVKDDGTLDAVSYTHLDVYKRQI